MRFLIPFLSLALIFGCSNSNKADPFAKPKAIVEPVKNDGDQGGEDPYLWLEEVEGEKALSLVKEANQATFDRLKNNELYTKLEAETRAIVYAKDKMPYVSLRDGMLHNFWQDKDHQRGLWRRTTIESYKQKEPNWEIVLDFDKLAKDENENWVYKGNNCLASNPNRCLVTLSRGGKDAAVVREFDVVKKQFVADGFVLPEAKNRVSWADENTLLVGTDFGEGSLSDSGYPIVTKEWKRGTPLSEAKEVFRGVKSDVVAAASVSILPEGIYRFYYRSPTFFEAIYWYEDAEGKRYQLPLPSDAGFDEIYDGRFFFSLRSELRVGERKIPQGSLVALPIESVKKGAAGLADLEIVFTPSKRTIMQGMARSKNTLFVQVLDNVNPKSLRAERRDGQWVLEATPEFGAATPSMVSAYSDLFLASSEDFLTPHSIYLGDASKLGESLQLLKSAPARFDSSGFQVEQHEAESRDGEMIPYFVVRKKDAKLDGKNPTLLYGYGGFEVIQSQFYLSSVGKLWVEKGGVFVMANIRGGGEFGPAWHQAALRENRQKAFDDFIAVGEDLIARKITSPRHLGIQGGSNGGLLVGSVFVQRPDLFNAVVCQVPLLDMLRYHLLLAGASWMSEYGNPDDPAMREAISKYSPYQNVKAGVKYPEVFFMTSTKDDRVHPSHARKMMAKMRDQGHPVLYFENTEGGHGGSANLEQTIQWSALEYTYLWQKLGLEE